MNLIAWVRIFWSNEEHVTIEILSSTSNEYMQRHNRIRQKVSFNSSNSSMNIDHFMSNFIKWLYQNNYTLNSPEKRWNRKKEELISNTCRETDIETLVVGCRIWNGINENNYTSLYASELWIKKPTGFA